MSLLISILVLLIAFFITAIILVAPGRATEEMKAPFRNRYFAHRGLHTPDRSVPENSLAAYEAACRKGYGIELDERLTSDGRVVMMHDPDLNRMCGVDLAIEDCTYEELSQYTLAETSEKIPLLKDALKLIDGRVPIIVEIKPCNSSLSLSKKTMSLLAPYTGAYCVESFDPTIVRWLKYNAPVVLRGQLAHRLKDYDNSLPWIGRLFAANCLFGLLGRPHFIAYETGHKPWTVKLTKLMGAMHVVWTSHPKEMGGTPEKDARENDSVIFEFYEPPINIK